MSDELIPVAMVALALVVYPVVTIVVVRRRGGSGVATVLAVVLLAIAVTAVFATYAHFDTLDDLSTIEFDEQRQPILDDSELPGIGAMLATLSIVATIALTSWVHMRSSAVSGRRPAALAMTLTGLTVTFGAMVAAFAITLPQDVYDRREGFTWADWVDVLVPITFIVGSLASASVARASRARGIAV